VSDPLLSVNNIARAFGGIRAVDDVSFDVHRGEVFGVVGPNGAGKTALLNCISGVYPVQSGTIIYNGQPIERLRPHKVSSLGIARTFQNTEYFNRFTVLDYLMLGRAKKQHRSIFACAVGAPPVRRRESSERDVVFAMLCQLDLGRYAEDRLSSLPYGLQKRIDIARALASEPTLVLLDEPTSGIAVQERAAIMEILNHVRELGITAVVVDHDVDFITRGCDRVLVMNFGRALGTGAPKELFQREDVLQAYIGV
jgi:branched-chain amino acid transport system ATP-binding protein